MGRILCVFCVRACSRNLSWQCVNLMTCIVGGCDGSMGGVVWFGTSSMYSMYGLSLAWQANHIEDFK